MNKVNTQQVINEIIAIEPENDFLKYIVARLQSNDYRGVHFSQHYRKDFDLISQVLKSISEVVDSDFFEIPRGDFKDYEKDINNFPSFVQIVEKIKKLRMNNLDEKKKTFKPDSLKKILLIDFDRMGFIDRFDDQKKITTGGRGKSIHFAKLSKDGIHFLQEKDIFIKFSLFTRGIDKYFGNFLSDIAHNLYYSNFKNTKISIYELMFIFSDKDNTVDKIHILTSYRSLEKYKRSKIIQLIKKYADPENFAGNKIQKRDFNNWKNQTTDILTLMKTTMYFEADTKGFNLNFGTLGIFDGAQAKRSQVVKAEYFEKHKVDKIDDFELHHIIPFRHAKNKVEFKLIDDYKNLIYLNKNKHKEITRNDDRHLILEIDMNTASFHDFEGDIVLSKNGDTAMYTKVDKIIGLMNKHNASLLKSVFEFEKK